MNVWNSSSFNTSYLAAPKDKKLQKITPAFFNTNKTNNMGSFLLQWHHLFLPVQFIIVSFIKNFRKIKTRPTHTTELVKQMISLDGIIFLWYNACATCTWCVQYLLWRRWHLNFHGLKVRAMDSNTLLQSSLTLPPGSRSPPYQQAYLKFKLESKLKYPPPQGPPRRGPNLNL